MTKNVVKFCLVTNTDTISLKITNHYLKLVKNIANHYLKLVEKILHLQNINLKNENYNYKLVWK